MARTGRNLVYTVALDRGGQTGHRNMAKMLVSSLLRTRFSGDILVFHNSPAPLFMVAREGVREVRLRVPDDFGPDENFVAYAQSCKHGVASHIDTAAYDRIMFIDCDALALRNIDHLFAGSWDLAVTLENGSKIQEYGYGGYLTKRERKTLNRDGMNSGTWAVSAELCGELLRHWRKVDSRAPLDRECLREQSAFNRVALNWDGVMHEWPRGEIALPLVTGHLTSYPQYKDAAIVHAASGHPTDYKLRFLFSIFAGRFLFDSQLAFFNIIEM
jgi:hypothetical protein